MPAATRKGVDNSAGHCWGPRPADRGSPNVIINGSPAVRTTDHYPLHSCPNQLPHDGVAGDGSPTVIINGLKTFRIGDPIQGGCGGADVSASGSPNVMVGNGPFPTVAVVEPGVVLIGGVHVYDNTPAGQAAARKDENTFDPDLGLSESTKAPPQPANQVNPTYIDCNKFPDVITMNDLATPVSKYFKLSNSAKSGMIQAQRGLSAKQIACNWSALCHAVLDPVYDQFRFNFNSGFRTVESGMGMTDHGIGCAADISLSSYAETAQMFKWIIQNQDKLGFSQCIFEKHNSAWVHISFNGAGPKGDARVMWTLNGGPPYSHGGNTGQILLASNFSQITA